MRHGRGRDSGDGGAAHDRFVSHNPGGFNGSNPPIEYPVITGRSAVPTFPSNRRSKSGRANVISPPEPVGASRPSLNNSKIVGSVPSPMQQLHPTAAIWLGVGEQLITPNGAPCPPTGNELGITVTFTCNSNVQPPPPGPTVPTALVIGCHLDRQDTGQFFLDVTGSSIKDGATVTVGGVTPKKVIEVEPGTTNPTKLRLIKKVCNGLPGNVIITNPGTNGGPSQPFNCTERCQAQ